MDRSAGLVRRSGALDCANPAQERAEALPSSGDVRRRATQRWFAHLSPSWGCAIALGLGLAGSNAIGIAVVIVLALVVVPMPEVQRDQFRQIENFVIGAVFVVLVGTVGTLHAWKILHPVVEMLRPDGHPTEDDQRSVLSAPRRIFVFQAMLWCVGSVVFLFVNVRYSWDLGFALFQIVLLAGWATSCFTYLLAERALRPVARKVLSEGIPNRRFVPSVRDRAMFAWALGTGAAVLGIVLVGVAVLRDPQQATARDLAVTVIVLGAVTLGAGWLSSFTAAQASSEPIGTLREALAQVEAGNLDQRLSIYDGTEIGLLQAGFNEMVTGLREREELRDLFGRHVGADVAEAALEKGVELGGEAREIAVLFVDIIGSTSLAEDRPPTRWSPSSTTSSTWSSTSSTSTTAGSTSSRATPPSRSGAPRWRSRTAHLRPGRGPDARQTPRGRGARHQGRHRGLRRDGGRRQRRDPERYEYTVIGDPVNEAARLTNHAKQVDGRVVANQDLVERATDDEGRRWTGWNRSRSEGAARRRGSPPRAPTAGEPRLGRVHADVTPR